MSKMVQVGVTGGIGSGKSLVCKIIKTFGIPVYDADSRARYLMEYDPELKDAIIHHFGPESYKEDKLNHQSLAKSVFNDLEQLDLLNQLVHPAVFKDYNSWLNQQENEIVVKEAALLFEAGSYQELDCTILVTSPEPLRIKRILKRDPQRSETQIRDIMARQWPDSKKQALADYIIVNNLNQMVMPQVLEYLEKIENRFLQKSDL